MDIEDFTACVNGQEETRQTLWKFIERKNLNSITIYT